MKRILYQLLGLPLVYAGVILLVCCTLFSLSRYTVLLILSLALIVAGIITYIYKVKH